MSTIRIGKFHVVDKLGTGAHSTILHVRRKEDGRNYALKVVPINGAEDQKFFEQAEHEFRVADMLEHDCLIDVYAFETVKDWFWRVRKVHLLIEFVNGKTLDECQGLRIPHLVQIFKLIADGLVHMHRRGVFHADLKPNNIMLSKAGEVKILDYGLAWIKGEAKNRVQGTPEYMAPEQIKHKMVNERSDLFNFGATMYRMLTWRLPPSIIGEEDSLPMDGKTWKRMLQPIHELNKQTPPALSEIVHKCLSYDARRRPERVSQVQAGLDQLVDELVIEPEDRLDALEW